MTRSIDFCCPLPLARSNSSLYTYIGTFLIDLQRVFTYLWFELASLASKYPLASADTGGLKVEIQTPS